MISPAFKRVNARLPNDLQIDRPTGHSGRHTFVTNSVNSGVDVQNVALASKHKSMAIQRYITPEDNAILVPAMAMARALPTLLREEEEEKVDKREKKRTFTIVEEEFEE